MAYGQTGAGKTFTITGSTENFQERGMIPRALSHLYQSINSMIEHSVVVRFVIFCVAILGGGGRYMVFYVIVRDILYRGTSVTHLISAASILFKIFIIICPQSILHGDL